MYVSPLKSVYVWGGYDSRLLKSTGLFGRILSLLHGSFAKKTYMCGGLAIKTCVAKANPAGFHEPHTA